MKYTGNHQVYGLTDMFFATVHYNHRAIIQIGYTLTAFLPVLYDLDHHFFAGKHHRFYRIRQLIDIEHLDLLKLGYFIQVKIIGNY